MADRTNQIYSLYEFTGMIKGALVELSAQKFWVQAHLHVNRGGTKGGHFYCDLVDVDDRGNQTAKMRGTIWSSRYNAILNKLKLAGYPNALQDNSEICVQCSVRYHELYGLSLDISDVDPTFGEAQINRNRRLIIEKFTQEGILKKNADLYLPAAALKIGLITSKDSAAYNDFVKTLFSSAYSFKIVLADSSMQGENTERDALAAIDRLEEAKVNVICIIRGGGSQADLAWFDNEKIARAIINCSVPVWVGIGHEIDVGVLDVVAHQAHKTPTAVAEALVNRLQELSINLDLAVDRLKHTTERLIALETSTLQRNLQGAVNGLRKYYTLIESNIKNYGLQTESKFIRWFNEHENNVRTKMILIQSKAFAMVKEGEGDLAEYHANLKVFTDNLHELKLQYNQEQEDNLGRLTEKFLQSSGKSLSGLKNRCQLARYMKLLLEKENMLSERSQRLASLKPENVLKRGYSITKDNCGQVIKSVDDLLLGQVIVTQYHDGQSQSTITKKGEVQ